MGSTGLTLRATPSVPGIPKISLPRAGGFNVLALNARGKLVGVKKKKSK